jgi:hypothetical protein
MAERGHSSVATILIRNFSISQKASAFLHAETSSYQMNLVEKALPHCLRTLIGGSVILSFTKSRKQDA